MALPDPQVLAARITGLSEEIAQTKTRLNQYSAIVDKLWERLGELYTESDPKLRDTN